MDTQDDLLTLRNRAEQALKDQQIDLDTLTLEEAKHLIHELQIQQMELEIQNKELLKSNQELFTLQEQFERLQHTYADLYDSAPVGYFTLDKDGTIIAANSTAVEYLGIPKTHLLSTRFHDYIIEEDRERFITYLEQAFAKNSQESIELKLRKYDGSQYSTRMESSLLQSAEEDPQCRLTVCDVTELSQAHATLLRRDGELALFNRVSQVFNAAHDLEHILVVLMEEVRRLLEVTASSIWLIDPDTHELFCQQAIGPHRDTIIGWRLEPGQGIVGWVAEHGESLLVEDTWTDERHFDGVDRLTGHPLHSILSVPMRSQQKIIGVVQVLDTQPNRFTETDQALQELLATMASMAIENARLHDQVRQDARTRKILLRELTQRVDTTLATTIRLFSTIRRHTRLKKQDLSTPFMADMLTRMKGLKSVYTMLSEYEWNPLPLSELTNYVIHATLDSLSVKKRVTVEVPPSSVRISPAQADKLGVAINELVTNTVKHAMAGRGKAHITVHIARIGNTVHFEFRDDGPGWPDDVSRFDRHNVGLYVLQKIVRKDLQGKLDLYNDEGAVVEIRFKI